MKRLTRIIPLTCRSCSRRQPTANPWKTTAPRRGTTSVVDDAPARAFFEGLVVGTRVNMLVHPDVKGRVSLSLKQVTLVEALEAARDMYGYDYRPMGNGPMSMAT